MLAIFDSGVGGLNTLKFLREITPFGELTLLMDNKSSPYGEKSESEIIGIIKRNIERLRRMGASKILLACCTASCFLDKLPASEKEDVISLIPHIIQMTKSESKNGRAVLIGTRATIASKAFPTHSEGLGITGIEAQELVSAAESGERDGNLSPAVEKYINSLCRRISETDADTLILGCTHFSVFENEFIKRLGISTVNSARVGAQILAKHVTALNSGEEITTVIRTIKE